MTAIDRAIVRGYTDQVTQVLLEAAENRSLSREGYREFLEQVQEDVSASLEALACDAPRDPD